MQPCFLYLKRGELSNRPERGVTVQLGYLAGLYAEGVIPNPAQFSHMRDLVRSLTRTHSRPAREILPFA
jgi:hypothetical protein